MNRFFIFLLETYYEIGGMHDFCCHVESEAKALEIIEKSAKEDHVGRNMTYQILDTKTGALKTYENVGEGVVFLNSLRK